MQCVRAVSANMPKKDFAADGIRSQLGPLEAEIMDVVWELGECSVREVKSRLPQDLAYTTVMTTLVRLFAKGFLQRTKVERKFLYSSRLTIKEWKRRVASEAALRFLSTPLASRELLFSCLWEVLAEQDPSALAKIRSHLCRRQQREFAR